MVDSGHSFGKKTFHKPTYCHHCSDLLWGLIGQGYICEVCNFIVHERCLSNVVTPCSGIAPCIINNPVAHCWSEPTQHKKKFCTVCRKRIDESLTVHCLICEYFAHVECQDFAVPDCKENATYVPNKDLSQVVHQHHWREGNLPPTSKCGYCRKACSSYECLTGYRCEWCGTTTHGGCRVYITSECKFGNLHPIYLPPHAVSIPRTEVPMEDIIGVQVKPKGTQLQRDYSCPRSISEEFSSGDASRARDEESSSKIENIPTASRDCKDGNASSSAGTSTVGGHQQRPETSSKYEKDKDKEKKDKDREERDEEMIKVFDGASSLKRRIYRVITVPRYFNLEQLLTASLRAFHISREPDAFYLTDLYAPNEESPLRDPNPILNLTHPDGKRPAIYLRFHDTDRGFVRVYTGKLQMQAQEPFASIAVRNESTVLNLIEDAIRQFQLEGEPTDYRCSEVLLDRGVTERILELKERPWEIMKNLGHDSIRQMELMRFYLQHKKDPHGPNIALFVGNLPSGLSERQYDQIITKFTTEEFRRANFGPIYYEYGSLIMLYEKPHLAVQAFYLLKEAVHEDKKLLVLLLPNITPKMVPPGVLPLLVFVNVKSGGCQGSELISSFRKLLNPYQVFDLDNGGPLPGLYVFREIKKYKILVCGGDGTIGWVLQCLDNVGQDSICSSPPCAIVPLGTGNDLARVLRWGPGYTGGEDPLNLLRDVIEAEEIRLDRWTVVFHPEDKPDEPALKAPTNTSGKSKKKKIQQVPISQQNRHHQLPAISTLSISGGATQSEDNSQIFVMNNYFGIGVDADLCLDFHNAREENPNKFNSRLHNKSVYLRMGLKKMVGRKSVDLSKELRLEVDGKVIELPTVEGIIILNILSWGSGANPWGPEKDDVFSKPNHYDGMLEIVGVTGVVHLGQIQSGLRSATRIAQGGHIKIHINTDLAVQVDGEPWIQSPSDIVVLKSALKATMLKKLKGKMKRRNTEPTMVVGSGGNSASVAASGGNINIGTSISMAVAPQESEENNLDNNTDF